MKPAEFVNLADMDLSNVEIILPDGTRLKRPAKRKAAPAPPKPEPVPPTTWTLTLEDLMLRTGKTRRWLFMHADELPFVRRVTRKTLRGDAAKLEKWFEQERRR
jgi:hypothetical protein